MSDHDFGYCAEAGSRTVAPDINAIVVAAFTSSASTKLRGSELQVSILDGSSIT